MHTTRWWMRAACMGMLLLLLMTATACATPSAPVDSPATSGTSHTESAPTTTASASSSVTALPTATTTTTVAASVTTVPHDTTEKLPVLAILSMEERDGWITVETTYGTFRYPAAFADILSPEVVYQGTTAQIQFWAQIAGRGVAVYTLHYREASGTRCGTLRPTGTAEEIAVYVSFAEATDEIPADWLDTFYAVQETFNDVLFSLAEDERFTAHPIREDT